MRMMIAAAVAGCAFAFAGAALAADATGVVKSLDTTKNVVTLDNGDSFDMAKGVSLSALKVGEKVTVTYSQSGKTMEGEAIKPAS